jgi:hypothetical protein
VALAAVACDVWNTVCSLHALLIYSLSKTIVLLVSQSVSFSVLKKESVAVVSEVSLTHCK